MFIVSHGKNGLGAFTSKGTQNVLPSGTDEQPNAPVAGTWAPAPTPYGFYQREYNDIPVTYFDDITLMLNPSDLITPLVKDGALQSAQSQYATLVANIQDWVASNITGYPSCTVPSPSSILPNLQIDPWGNKLNAIGSPFIYTPMTFSSSVPQVYTLVNPSAMPPNVSPSGAMMIRIYPFLNNGC